MALTLDGSKAAIATIGGVAEDVVRDFEIVYSGSGADILTGDALANLFRGGGGADVLDGGGGIDAADYRDKLSAVSVTLRGAGDAVVKVGGAAEDTLRNIEGIYGGNGSDALAGDALDNQFYGGLGNDLLRGAGGADLLNGGAGADRFIFVAVGDSTLAAYDRIVDFNGAEGDRIDLSYMDAIAGGADDAFTLTNAFTAAGQIRVIGVGANLWRVEAEVTGDGKADFFLAVTSTTALTAADFLL